MCKAFALVALTLLLAGPAHAERMLFADDFKGVVTAMPDGTQKAYPDRARWGFSFWPGFKWPDSYGNGTNWLDGNSESQTYVTPFIDKIKGQPVPSALRYDPFNINKDGLHIRAALLSPAQQAAYQVGGYRRFGSGILLSRFAFTYGHVRMVAKLPSARGSWPALWLLPASHEWPPEIDIFEGMAWGAHATQIHVGVLTSQHSLADLKKWIELGVDPSRDFHEYGMDWSAARIDLLFDGRVIASAPTPDNMHQDMYLLVNLAVGGKWPYNETGIKPVDSTEPERLARGADAIQGDYPAELIVRSIKVTADQ